MTRTQIEGAFWKILACLCFAAINGIVKFLSPKIPTASIAFFQNCLGLIWLLPFLMHGQRKLWRTQCLHLQLWRVIASCTGLLLWYKALSAMPMGQAVALNFTGPLMTVVGARIFFHERLTASRLIAIFLGFVGSILIVNARYLTGEIPWGTQGWEVLLPLGSASAFSICTLLNKRLTAYDAPLTIVAYLTVCMIPFLGLFAWPEMSWPSVEDWRLLAVLGFLSSFAHFSFTRSFVCNDVTFLLPFGSIRLIASACIGFFFFDQFFNSFVALGFAVVLTALFILTYFEKNIRKG